jgi:hypothetical protein
MATVVDSPEGAAFSAMEIGQATPFPGDVQHLGGQPPVNQVVINTSAGTGLVLDGSGAYKASGQFGVHLAASPGANGATVDVGVVVNPGNGVSVSPASLSFTSGNFSSDQLVTVSSAGHGQSGIKCHLRGGGALDADVLVVA